LRNANLMEELPQYWPSKFFAHFGNWCQWGRSFEGLRELVYALGFVLKHLSLMPFMLCILSCCFAWLSI
jgi:hypothetical protein